MRQSHCKCVTQHVLEFRSPDSTTRDSRFLGGGGKEDSRLRFSETPIPALTIRNSPESGTYGLWSDSQSGKVWKELRRERTSIIPNPWGYKQQT